MDVGAGKHGSKVAGLPRGMVRYGLLQAKPAPKGSPAAKLTRAKVCVPVDVEPLLSAMED